MTKKEHQEFNCWIAENVMGEFLGKTIHTDDVRYEDSERKIVVGMAKKYTTDPAAAMEVLKKCIEAGEGYQIQFDKCNQITWGKNGMTVVMAETLELAICQFSRKLFEYK